MSPSSSRPAIQRSFVIEWTSYTCTWKHTPHLDNFQSRMNWENYEDGCRLLVLPGSLDEKAVQKLTTCCEVEREFLHAYMQKGLYRPRYRSGGASEKSWCWKFPQLLSFDEHAEEKCTGSLGKVELLGAYLWVGTDIDILIVEPWFPRATGVKQPSALEDDILGVLADRGSTLSVADYVGKLIYKRWVEYMARLDITEAVSSVLWELTAAVEQNIEQTKFMRHQRDGELLIADEEAWNNIMSMIKHRENLKMLEHWEKWK
ncbi:hypothetical protein ACHAQJ_005383 [Trichoderma viride]